MPFKFNPFSGTFDEVQDISEKVDGPASSTDNAVARFDSTTGKLIQNSSAILDDAGKLTLGADGSANLDAVTKQQLDAVSDAIVNLAWQDPVIDKDLTAPPGSPSTGDRYLIGLDTAAGAATGAWAGEDGKVTEWNGASWDFYTPANGWFVSADDETDVVYGFAGTTWTAKSFESTTASGFLSKSVFDIQLTNLINQNLIIGNGSNVATSTDTNSVGDILANSASGLTIKAGAILDADVNASAAIALSKLAAVTANRALASNASGVVVPSAVTDTELGYVSGVTSSIQTQLNGKQDAVTTTAISSNATLAADTYNLVNTSVARTLTLPAASDGATVYIKDVTGSAKANNITVNTPGAETIDGDNSLIIDSEYQFTKLVSDGTNWFIV
jgi:hypothetical protein